MALIRWCVPVVAATSLIVGTPAASASPPPGPALTHVTAARVLFGHQSVGWNIIDGMNSLYARRGVPGPEVVDDTLPATGPAFAQREIGTNGDPASKFLAFKEAVDSAASLDVAAMKLCFVDITAGTSARAVFGQYKATVAQIQARHPDVPLVHVTVPLTVDDPASNVVRQRYNQLLRSTYGPHVFDLARTESTRPDGSRVGGRFHGHRYFALFQAYAADEGHLNDRGARRAAAGFVAALAQEVP